MIKLTFTEKNLPAEFKAIAGEADDKGNFVFEVASSETHLQLIDDIKTLNTKLADGGESAEKLTKLLDGKTLEEFEEGLTELKSVKQQVEDGKLQGNKEISEQVEARVAKVQETHQEQLRVLTEQNAELKAGSTVLEDKIESNKIDTAFLRAQATLPDGIQLKPAYQSYIEDDVKKVFRISDEGSVTGYELNKVTNTETVMINSSTGAPISVTDYIVGVFAEKPEMFEKPIGSGSKDSVTSGGGMSISQEDFDKLSPMEKMEFAGSQKN